MSVYSLPAHLVNFHSWLDPFIIITANAGTLSVV